MKELKFTKTVSLNQKSLNQMEAISKVCDITTTGVIRISIDYLYCVITGLKIPDELQSIIDDLKNDMK